MVALTERQEQLKEAFMNRDWNPAGRTLAPFWEIILRLDPDYFEAAEKLIDTHWKLPVLDPKTRELIYLALASHVTLRYVDGIRSHMTKAKKHGATPQEIMEVLELSSVIGLHGPDLGVPILMEELAQLGRPVDGEPYSERQQKLKEHFTTTGPRPRAWAQLYEGLLRLDPDFFEVMIQFIDAPWDHGVLTPKVKELIYVAIDVTCTHLNATGLRRHIQKALGEGATPQELMAVMEIAVGPSMINSATALPILVELYGPEQLVAGNPRPSNGQLREEKQST
jgi:alkylhydroperoxidase/carboxymuconolactone decarboxylase family protein YurZ